MDRRQFEARVRLNLKRKIWALSPTLAFYRYIVPAPTPVLEALVTTLIYGKYHEMPSQKNS